MKRFLLLFLFPVLAIAQSTTVSTAGVVDTDGFTWSLGSYNIQFVPSPSSPNIASYVWSGGNLQANSLFSGTLNSGGQFSVSIPSNSAITPSGSMWKFTICPNASKGCFVVMVPANGPTQDLTATLNASAIGPRFASSTNTYGYGTVEINTQPQPGQIFFNNTTQLCNQWNSGSWQPCGNGGSGSNPAPPSFAVQFANSPVSAFQGDAKILINPTVHSLTSPILNGRLFAAGFVTGGGNNGIANATAGATNQMVIADPSYGSTEQYSFFGSMIPNLPNNYHFEDLRSGIQSNFFHDWGQTNNFGFIGSAVTLPCLVDTWPLTTTDNGHHFCETDWYSSIEPGWSQGTNVIASPQWSVRQQQNKIFVTHSSGIDQVGALQLQKYGVGDTITQYLYMNTENGTTAGSDEGAKALGINAFEDLFAFAGTCITNCTLGATTIKANVTIGAQGTDRKLIDLNRVTATTVSNMVAGVGPATAMTVAATVPVSNAWGTQNAYCGPTPLLNYTPPFSVSTTCVINVISGTFDTSHLLCFESAFHECAIPTAVSTVGSVATLTIPLRHEHYENNPVFQGGMAGYGMEFTKWTQTFSGNPIRYLLDVVGSTDAHTLQVGYFNLGGFKPAETFGPINPTFVYGAFNISTLTNSGTTVSGISSPGTINHPEAFNAATYVIAGASDTAFNHPCTNFQWSSTTIFTCTISGLSGSHTSVSATASFGASNVNLFPMAQVIDVQNEALTPPLMDGTLVLEPNIIPFATNDNLEEPHDIASQLQGATMDADSVNPWNKDSSGLGVSIQGVGYSADSANAGFTLTNLGADSLYNGAGGLTSPPGGIHIRGYWNSGLVMDEAPGGFQLLSAGLSAAQDANALFNYNLVNGAAHGGNSCALNLTTRTDTLSFNGCFTVVFPQGAGAVVLPAINLTTTAGFQSAVGYNYAPYSNSFDNTTSGGVWLQTGGGSGSVTCAIVDDFGDPACTLTNSDPTFNYNYEAENPGAYTNLPANTAMTFQLRGIGAVGGEVIGMQAGLQGGGATLTTSWADYCVHLTTTSSFLTHLASLIIAPSSTVKISNIVVRPGSQCGPPLKTTGTGGTMGAQFTTPTAVNNAGTMNIGTLTLPNISGSTQCLHVDTNGLVSGTGVDCGTGSGSSNLLGGALGSVPYQSAPNTTTFVASPTTASNTFLFSWQPSGSTIAPVALNSNTWNATFASMSTGTGSSACGSATGCVAFAEAATTGTPSAGNDYIRADSVSHRIVSSLNGGAEAPIVAVGTLTYTTATSDSATITGVTASSNCTFSPTNATAAAATVIAYVSAVATNTVTITHVATTASGGTINIQCSQ